ncbi:hypothetical protein K523DRAFT_144666 [Schizophyllum commune Tattone D]|nr:hypothetical protein K523DRAFT_144666 [Schizophyllum commune Tattone D]
MGDVGCGTASGLLACAQHSCDPAPFAPTRASPSPPVLPTAQRSARVAPLPLSPPPHLVEGARAGFRLAHLHALTQPS